MVRVFYSPQYVRAGYAFDTTRKAHWIADSISAAPIPGIALVEPTPLTGAQVAEVHDAEYVRAVETGTPRGLAQSQGFDWDPGLWPMVLASNGGAVAAALAALEEGVAGSLSSGLHHARRERGAGYCTFNGLAIAAGIALAAAARSVLVLDLDAHGGGGTRSLIRDDARIWQVDVCVSPYDNYPNSERIQLELVEDSVAYLSTMNRCLDTIASQGPRFDLCLYNAGMDPHEDCDTGGLAGITRDVLAQRETLVFAWCREHGVPIAFVLAGGYTGGAMSETALVGLHRLTLASAAGLDPIQWSQG